MERIVKEAALNYETYEKYISMLKKRYSSLKVAECGESILGKRISALVVGSGKRNILYAGGIHGGEWASSVILLKFCENILRAQSAGTELAGCDINEILRAVSLIIVPEINPDGIEICINGFSAAECFKEQCETVSQNCSEWNSNARGVDISKNFDAGWTLSHDLEKRGGITGACAGKYGGEYPESEPETRAMTRICREIDISRLVELRTGSGEIFYEYAKSTPPKSLMNAKIFSALSGYTLVKNNEPHGGGDFKDWFIYETEKPAFTVNAGRTGERIMLWEINPVYDDLEEMLVAGLIL